MLLRVRQSKYFVTTVGTVGIDWNGILRRERNKKIEAGKRVDNRLRETKRRKMDNMMRDKMGWGNKI